MTTSRLHLPQLPTAAWMYQSCKLLSSTGMGISFPFLLIYLHNSRHIGLSAAGAIIAARIVTYLVGSTFGGKLVDSRGAATAIITGSLMVAAGWFGLAFATHIWSATLAVVVSGVGGGLSAPGESSFLSRLVDPSQRHTIFSLAAVGFNLGYAGGALIASSVANAAHPWTYSVLLIATAASNLPVAVLTLILSRATKNEAMNAKRKPGGSYREALRQRVVVRVALANVAFFMAGASLWEVGIAAYLRNAVHFHQSQIGVLFAVNTIGVVVLQFAVTKAARGRQRLHVLGVGLLVWSAAFVSISSAAHWLHGVALLGALMGSAALIAIAECAAPPVVQPLVADIAPEHIQGRCMALIGKGRAAGMASGSMIVGFALAHQPGLLWPSGAAVLAFAGFAMLKTSVPEEHRYVA